MKNSVLILIIMINSRIIAVIYVIDNKVVLSRNFGNYSFIGSIDIVVSYMNKWEVDEIIILDIKNSIYQKDHLLKILKKISQLCQTPLSVGGGINNLKQISKIINSGVEKVVLNSNIYNNYNLIKKASNEFGSQAINCCIDFKKNGSNFDLYSHSGKMKQNISCAEHIKRIQNHGAGEIMINSIDRDGTGTGYDLDFYKKYKSIIKLPFIYSGGFGNLDHLIKAINLGVISFGIGNSFNFIEHCPILYKSELNKKINRSFIRKSTKISYDKFSIDEFSRLGKLDDNLL